MSEQIRPGASFVSLHRADLTLAACQDHLELQNILVSGCTPEILVDLVSV